MPTDSLCAMIPVRAGSKRVENKNLRPFAGSSLLEIKIRQLQAVEDLGPIYVSSDSVGMLNVAADLGATPLERPVELASDSVPMSDVYAFLAGSVAEHTIVFTHVTNPMCGPEVYQRAIRAYGSRDPRHDSLTTVSDVKEFLYWDGKPVNFDPRAKPRSQDLPDIVKLNHAVSIAPAQLMIDQKNLFGEAPILMTLDGLEAFDIDTELDFEVAEFLYERWVSGGR